MNDSPFMPSRMSEQSQPIRLGRVDQAGRLSKAQRARLRKLIREHVDAAIGVSWAGAGDPEDYEQTIAEAERAHERLQKYIRGLTK